MMPEVVFRDLMNNTIYNYEFVKERQSEHGPYEVTQLISSFVMVAGLPRERDIYSGLESISIEEARTEYGLPNIAVVADAAEYEIRHMADLAGMFRNAVAHGNLTFYPVPRGNTIGSLRFSDQRKRNNVLQKRYSNELTIQQVEDTLYAFQKIAQALYDRATRRTA
jgi:hypothetical protein